MLLLLPLVTCSNLDNIEVTETAQTVLAGATLVEQLIGDLGFGDWLNLDITQNKTMANQGVERHQLDTVYLQSVELSMTESHPDQDFSFIERIEFYAKAPGLTKRLIATGGPFAAGLKIVGMDVEDVNLASFASSETMTITTDVVGRRPHYRTTIEATIVLGVDINVAGIICGSEI